MLAPAALWKTFWPVASGVIVALVFRRSNLRLPPIPEGDIAALGGWLSRLATACGAVFVKVDGVLRLWTTACLALLLIVVLLTVAMRAGG